MKYASGEEPAVGDLVHGTLRGELGPRRSSGRSCEVVASVASIDYSGKGWQLALSRVEVRVIDQASSALVGEGWLDVSRGVERILDRVADTLTLSRLCWEFGQAADFRLLSRGELPEPASQEES